VGDPFANPIYQELGKGSCVTRQQMIRGFCLSEAQCGEGESPPPAKRYYGYALDRSFCERQCNADPLCVAYDYGYSVCSIYGGHRTMSPSADYWGGVWVLEAIPAQIEHDVQCYSKRASDVNNTPPYLGGTFFAVSVAAILLFPTLWVMFKYCGAVKRSYETVFARGPEPPTEAWTYNFDELDENPKKEVSWPESPTGDGSIAASPKALYNGETGNDDGLALAPGDDVPEGDQLAVTDDSGIRDPRGQVADEDGGAEPAK